MSTREWKEEQLALEEGNAIECPHCHRVIFHICDSGGRNE